jgi:hypothetical protein
MNLMARINQIERQLGTAATPRHIALWCGPQFEENWIEWDKGWDGNSVDLYVRTPAGACDPMEHLTAEQLSEIRPGDSLVKIWMSENGRDEHLQLNKPPWKRQPWSVGSGSERCERPAAHLAGSIDEPSDRLNASPRLASHFAR